MSAITKVTVRQALKSSRCSKGFTIVADRQHPNIPATVINLQPLILEKQESMMADNQNRGSEPPKNEHGQGFKDRPAGEKSRYDPELEMPDPQQVEQDIQESEKTYRDRKEPAA